MHCAVDDSALQGGPKFKIATLLQQSSSGQHRACRGHDITLSPSGSASNFQVGAHVKYVLVLVYRGPVMSGIAPSCPRDMLHTLCPQKGPHSSMLYTTGQLPSVFSHGLPSRAERLSLGKLVTVAHSATVPHTDRYHYDKDVSHCIQCLSDCMPCSKPLASPCRPLCIGPPSRMSQPLGPWAGLCALRPPSPPHQPVTSAGPRVGSPPACLVLDKH